MKRTTPLAGAILVAFALTAAACSGSSPLDAYRTTSTSTTTSTPAAAATTSTTSGPTQGQYSIPVVDAPGPDPTPLPTDPDLRLGQLDNGLTYYLRSNKTPGGSVSLRLVVNAGSAQQEQPDGGTAHFLEHMMFNGTREFPGNELTAALAKLGIQFGADTNAYTSYDETVYMLAAETSNSEAVSTAFDVLAQWASAATLEPADVTAEIGVVRDEMRQGRESTDGMIQTEFENMYTANSSYDGYATIGSPGPVESMTAPPLRAFYDRWYRPDNMAVVVVGDMPLDAMEKAVTERFAAMQPRGADAPTHNDYEVSINPEPQGRVVTNPDNVVDNISVDIQMQPWDLATVGGERLALIEQMMASMLDTRLASGFQSGDLHTSTSPSMGPFAVNRGLQYIGTNIQGDDPELALGDLIAIWKGAALSGFTADEFSRAVDETLTALDDTLQASQSRQDFRLASSYVSHFLEGADIDAVESMVSRETDMVRSITREEVTNHWRWVLQTSGPIIAAVGADPSTLPTAERLVEIARDTPPSTDGPTTPEAPIEALMTPPEPSEVTDTSSSRTADGSIVEWDLPNGARVVFQQSAIESGTVRLTTSSDGGWSQMPTGSGALTSLITDSIGGSGLGEFTKTQLDDYLSNITATVFPYLAATSEGFVGSSSTDDIEVMFQILNLLITAARVDDPAFRQARTFASNTIAASTLDPQFRAGIAMNDARTSGSPDWVLVPTEEQLAGLDPGSVLDLYNSRLGKLDQPIVAIVGDADPAVVEDLARRYIGSIPAGPHDTWVDLMPPMPAGITSRVIDLPDGVNTGGVDMLMSTPVDVTARLDVVATVFETILSARIIDTIREKLGASYGGSATVSVAYAPAQRIDASINIDGDPTRVDEIRQVLLEQIADLAANGPTADEFDQAVSVVESDYHFVNNGLFADAIIDTRRFPDETILTADNRLGLLARVRPADIGGMARFALPPTRRIEIIRTVS